MSTLRTSLVGETLTSFDGSALVGGGADREGVGAVNAVLSRGAGGNSFCVAHDVAREASVAALHGFQAANSYYSMCAMLLL